MKKLLYITGENIIEGKGYIGIRKKIFGQLKCLERNEIKCYLVTRNICLNKLFEIETEVELENFSDVSRKEYYDNLISLLNKYSIDIIYVRYFLIEEEFINFIKNVKENLHLKIFLDIPTFPYDKIFASNKEGLMEDIYWRRLLKDYVDWTFNYNQLQSIYDIPSTNLINGVDLQTIRKKRITDSETIRMISVSALEKWHGIDRMIEGMRNYKLGGGIRNVQFLIIGDGRQYNELSRMINEYDLSDEVKMVGAIDDERRLQEYFDNSDIAIGGLAPYRIGKTEKTGAIKYQEYCARGIPFVLPLKGRNFPDDAEFIHLVPNDNTPIQIENIIDFFDRLDMSGMCDDMRKYAEEHFAWDKILKTLIDKCKE